MLRRSLLLMSLCGTITVGCSAMQKPHASGVVTAAGSMRPETKPRLRRSGERAAEVARADSPTITAPRDLVETSAAADAEDGWLARARRRLRQVSRDIAADLDFHETEGLEAFAPDALEQVNMLRGDMNASANITR